MKKSRNQPPPPQQRRNASVARLCGLRDGASEPAIKGALLRKNAVIAAVADLTGARTEDEMVGHLRAVRDDIARLAQVESENKKLRHRASRRERMDLLGRLAAAKLPGYTRGELLVDHVDEGTGKRTVAPAPVYAEMKLGTLRGLVESKLKNGSPAGPPPRRTPFDADPNKVKASVESAQLERAVATPEVQRMAVRSSASPEQIARTLAALNEQGAFMNGAN